MTQSSSSGCGCELTGVAVSTLAFARSTIFDSSSTAFENMPNSVSFGAYCWPNILSLPSSADKHQAGGVDQVGQVEDEVDSGEHGYRHELIPNAQPLRAAATAWPVFCSVVLGVKVEYGPDDGCWQIEGHSQQGIGRQKAGKWEGKAAGALSYAEQNDGRWQDEADAVDGHAVLEFMLAVIQHRVADEDEDDAGHEGLADFQQARGCGHVAGYLAWTRLADAHLAHVGDSGQAGKDGWHDAEVALTLACGALEEVEGEDDGGRQAEQGGVASKGDGEVLPGKGGSGLQAEQLHQDNEQSPSEAEGPAEDAPVSGTMGDSAAMHGHGESHAGEDHGCQPCP